MLIADANELLTGSTETSAKAGHKRSRPLTKVTII